MGWQHVLLKPIVLCCRWARLVFHEPQWLASRMLRATSDAPRVSDQISGASVILPAFTCMFLRTRPPPLQPRSFLMEQD
eukprot:3454122-Alexandrium_andersonii.AAC.1